MTPRIRRPDRPPGPYRVAGTRKIAGGVRQMRRISKGAPHLSNHCDKTANRRRRASLLATGRRTSVSGTSGDSGTCSDSATRPSAQGRGRAPSTMGTETSRTRLLVDRERIGSSWTGKINLQFVALDNVGPCVVY